MNKPGLSIVGQDAGHAPPPAGPVVLQSGFRPFFALAALAAVALVPLWLVVLSGGLGLRPALDPLAWHGHEMIHGFAIALIVGVAVGTYSSIYVAANTLLMLGVSKEDLMIPVKEGAEQEDMMP